jgi:hypothetical protein
VIVASVSSLKVGNSAKRTGAAERRARRAAGGLAGAALFTAAS